MYIIQCRNYMANFNPHFRKGSDAISTPTITISNHISIHTSAREVTVRRSGRFCNPPYFNPHFRKGSDRKATGGFRYSTDFNPHFRKGSDLVLLKQYHMSFGISIHTSAREVTEWASFSDLIKNISIHTSAREVTLMRITIRSMYLFQSTLPQGK